MIIRYSAAVVAATIVTVGLFYVMQLMISTGRDVITEHQAARLTDFVRVERTRVAATRESKPERPRHPERRPALPQARVTDRFEGRLAVSMTNPTIETRIGTVQGVGAISDGEYLPIVKVAPVYPTRALTRRLEGFVIVEFTVTTAGTVRDVLILESTAEIFEDAAVEAALKFRYKPRVIDGEPVEVVGVRNKIVFTVDQSQRMAMK